MKIFFRKPVKAFNMGKWVHRTYFGYAEMELIEKLAILTGIGKWPTQVHKTSEQKRQIRALWAVWDKDPSMPEQKDYAIIEGYQTSHEFCSCEYFQKKLLPCKHIYLFYVQEWLKKRRAFTQALNRGDDS